MIYQPVISMLHSFYIFLNPRKRILRVLVIDFLRAQGSNTYNVNMMTDNDGFELTAVDTSAAGVRIATCPKAIELHVDIQ